MDKVLLKAAEKQALQARAEFNKFVSNLATSPLQTLLFGIPGYEATARMTVWERIIERIRAGVAVADLVQELQALALQHSENGPAAANLAQTCMTQHLAAEYSRAYKKMAFYERNPVAMSLD